MGEPVNILSVGWTLRATAHSWITSYDHILENQPQHFIFLNGIPA